MFVFQRRAIGEQSTNDDRVKLTEAEATQKAKYESEQFSEAEQEMRAEQRNADAQEQKLQSDKQQEAKSSIRDSAKAKAELAEMDRQESAAERKKAELELQEQKLVSNVESAKGAVLELAVKHKSDSVSLSAHSACANDPGWLNRCRRSMLYNKPKKSNWSGLQRSRSNRINCSVCKLSWKCARPIRIILLRVQMRTRD